MVPSMSWLKQTSMNFPWFHWWTVTFSDLYCTCLRAGYCTTWYFPWCNTKTQFRVINECIIHFIIEIGHSRKITKPKTLNTTFNWHFWGKAYVLHDKIWCGSWFNIIHLEKYCACNMLYNKLQHFFPFCLPTQRLHSFCYVTDCK